MADDRGSLADRRGQSGDRSDVATRVPRSRFHRLSVAPYGDLRATAGRLHLVLAGILVLVRLVLGGSVAGLDIFDRSRTLLRSRRAYHVNSTQREDFES